MREGGFEALEGGVGAGLGAVEAGVVAEAMVALVLANSVLEKFGGDSVGETKRNFDAYLASIPENLTTARASQSE